MLADLRAAERQFEENVRLLGPKGNESDPEKFNLYMGLANLAGGLANLTNQVSTLQQDIRNIK